MNYDTIFQSATKASTSIATIDEHRLNQVLLATADQIRNHTDEIMQANAIDLNAMPESNLLYDRLRLTPQRIAAIADDVEQVARLEAPQGRIIEQWTRPNGMKISKVSVPFGVIGIICEARPNVTIDVFSLCLKTANACVVKGGRDAINSNLAIAKIIRQTLRDEGLDENIFTLLDADHAAAMAMLNAEGLVDVVIPRGGKGLIRFVRENSRIPVIETGAGIVHTYFDKDGDRDKGLKIINNSKTRRVSVCNALDCLVIHRERLEDLAYLCSPLSDKQVSIYADEEAYAALSATYPIALLHHATAEHFGTEFLDYKMAIRTVGSIDEAIAHISFHTSRHSEAIVTENNDAATQFTRKVDAACVYVNLPTSFTDGGEFGFGAEIGISTQKLHARGPMGLKELTTYKYIIEGDGQTRL